MKSISERLKAYMESNPLDTGDPNCGTALDQIPNPGGHRRKSGRYSNESYRFGGSPRCFSFIELTQHNIQ